MKAVFPPRSKRRVSMRRSAPLRAIMMTATLVVLAACGGSSTEDSVIADTQVSVTEPASDTVSDDERPAPSTSMLSTEATPAPSTTTTPTDKKTEPSVPDAREAGSEPASTTTKPDDETESTTPISGDLDASALLSAAGEASAGQSVRGEFTVGMSSVTDAVLASATFETDAEGNTAMTFSLFGSLSMEFRFVDDMAYVQLPAMLLSSLGLETTVPDPWLTVDDASAAELGAGCPSPLSFLEPGGSTTHCDPLGDTAMLLPEFVDDATIVGREALRGFQTTVIRVTPSAQDLIGLGLESLPDSENGGNDPEALEEMFPVDADIRVDIWIDDDLRIHRTVLDLGSLMAGLTGTDGQGLGDMPRIVSTTDYYDHDAEIVVEAPLPEQVVGDLADLQDLEPDG